MDLRAKWYQNPEADMKEYRLYRTDGERTLIAAVAHPNTEHLFSVNVTGNGTLKFVLTAIDTGGLESIESDSYNIDYGETPPPPPPPPTNEAPGKPTGFVVEIVIAPPPPPPPPEGGYRIDDYGIYPTNTDPKPAKGQVYIDPLFPNIEIVRITDALVDVGPGRDPLGYCHIGYPKHDIENADGTKLIIQSLSDSTWHIWNANPPYNRIQTIPPDLIGWGRAIDCRWDAVDPDVLYFTMSPPGGPIGFFKYEVSQTKMTLLHDFTNDFTPTANSVSMNEEGCPSDDSRYWALLVGVNLPHQSGRLEAHLICYDKEADQIISTLDCTTLTNGYQIPGFSSMSPSGKWVWTGDSHFIYPRENLQLPKNLNFNSHADMAISKEGKEVIFGFALKGGMWSQGYWAHMCDLDTAQMFPMGSQSIGLPRYHFSGNCHLKPGWGLMSTYATNQSQGGGPHWADFELVMFELTTRTTPKPRVWRIAKSRGGGGGYNDACFAKLNRKGTKVWFGSRWGGGGYDVYQINLPATWYEDLG